MQDIRLQVERLAALMSQSKRSVAPVNFSDVIDLVPGKRYALTLQLMLKRGQKRKSASVTRSPKTLREHPHPAPVMIEQQQQGLISHKTFSPTYDPSFASTEAQMHMGAMPPYMTDVDSIWRGFEMTSNEQLPVWISDQSLGGVTFSQQGMNAFLLPTDYLPPAQQIW